MSGSINKPRPQKRFVFGGTREGLTSISGNDDSVGITNVSQNVR